MIFDVSKTPWHLQQKQTPTSQRISFKPKGKQWVFIAQSNSNSIQRGGFLMFSLLRSCTWLCVPVLLLVLPASLPTWHGLQATHKVFIGHVYIFLFFRYKVVSLSSLLFLGMQNERMHWYHGEEWWRGSPKWANLHPGSCSSFDLEWKQHKDQQSQCAPPLPLCETCTRNLCGRKQKTGGIAAMICCKENSLKRSSIIRSLW